MTQLLHGKARYLAGDMDGYPDQARFDAELSALGLDLSGFGPDGATLEAELARRGLRVEGFRLVGA